VVRLLENESCSVLVATDLAARGWDVTGLSAVVNLGGGGVSGSRVRSIDIDERCAYVAVERGILKDARAFVALYECVVPLLPRCATPQTNDGAPHV
jgi:hypothetical protein